MAILSCIFLLVSQALCISASQKGFSLHGTGFYDKSSNNIHLKLLGPNFLNMIRTMADDDNDANVTNTAPAEKVINSSHSSENIMLHLDTNAHLSSSGTHKVTKETKSPVETALVNGSTVRNDNGYDVPDNQRHHSLPLHEIPTDDFGAPLLGQESETNFRMAALLAHNLYRTRHKSPPLKLNQQLSREAEVEAKHIAKYGRTQNDRRFVLWNTNKGENVARGCNKLGLTASGAVKRWYDEVCSYDWTFKGIVPKARRFMQLIWKGTHEFGIGRAAGFKKGQLCTYIVARYKPGLMNNFTFESSIDKGFFNSTSCQRNKPGAWRKMVKVHRLHSTNADGFSNHLNKNVQEVRKTAKRLSAPLQSGSSLPTEESLEYDDAAVSQKQMGEKDPLPYSATLQDPNSYPGYRSKDDMHSSISQRMEDFIWPDESDDKNVYNDLQNTPQKVMQEQNVNSPNKVILEDSKDFPHNDQDDLPSNELPQSDEYSSQFDSDGEPQPQDDFTVTFDSDADRQHLSDDVKFHKPDEDNLFNLDDGRMDDNNKKRGMNKRQSGKIK